MRGGAWFIVSNILLTSGASQAATVKRRHLLIGYQVENVALTGAGVIDGNGPAFFGDCDEDSRFPSKAERQAGRKPLATNGSVFFPASELPGRPRLDSIIVGEAYHADIGDILACVRRAAEREEVLVITSHDIAPDAKGIHMKTEWLEKMFALAQELTLPVLGCADCAMADGGLAEQQDGVEQPQPLFPQLTMPAYRFRTLSRTRSLLCFVMSLPSGPSSSSLCPPYLRATAPRK